MILLFDDDYNGKASDAVDENLKLMNSFII